MTAQAKARMAPKALLLVSVALLACLAACETPRAASPAAAGPDRRSPAAAAAGAAAVAGDRDGRGL